MSFEELKALLAEWLGATTTKRFPEAVRGSCVNMSIRELSRNHDLWFCETIDTFPTIVNDYDYALPARWIRPHSLWYINSEGARKELVYKEKLDFDRAYPTPATVTGEPLNYTWFGGYLYLGPTPSSILTINRNYYRLFADLTDSSPNNTNLFLENAWEPIFYRALVKGSKFLMQDERVSVWQPDADDSEAKLAAEHRRAKSAARGPAPQSKRLGTIA
jgi:hypothetical protein